MADPIRRTGQGLPGPPPSVTRTRAALPARVIVPRLRAVLLALLTLAVLPACTGPPTAANTTAPTTDPPGTPGTTTTDAASAEAAAATSVAGTPPAAEGDALSGDLTVFAAASLTEALTEIGNDFSERHPGVGVVLNLAGSSTLATQIVQGAPADVFASADPRQMDVVAEGGLLAAEPAVFATNRLAIAVEPDNPLGVAGLEDLADPGVTLVLAAEEVPSGSYAQQALDTAGVAAGPASREPSVRAVLARVALGEADAGIVYTSDIVAAGDRVGAVDIPDAVNVTATYPVAPLTSGTNPSAGAAFAAYLAGDAARTVLTDHGFTVP